MSREREWTYVDEFFAVPVLCSTSLVLEDNIVVPAAFHVEVLRVEQRISPCDINFTLLFFLCCSLTFLVVVSQDHYPGCIFHTSFSFCANRSFLIFSSSRISSAASSSSSLYSCQDIHIVEALPIELTCPHRCSHLLLTHLSRRLYLEIPPICAGAWPLDLRSLRRFLPVQLRADVWGPMHRQW